MLPTQIGEIIPITIVALVVGILGACLLTSLVSKLMSAIFPPPVPKELLWDALDAHVWDWEINPDPRVKHLGEKHWRHIWELSDQVGEQGPEMIKAWRHWMLEDGPEPQWENWA